MTDDKVKCYLQVVIEESNLNETRKATISVGGQTVEDCERLLELGKGWPKSQDIDL